MADNNNGQHPAPPPHNIDAEESLLGSMLLSSDAIRAAISANITANDFYAPEHGRIYEAVCASHIAGEHADVVTITARAHGDDRLRKHLSEILIATPASANAPAYARIVRDCARRRELIATARRVSEAAQRGDDVADALAHITTISTETDTRRRLATGGAFVHDQPDLVDAVWGDDDRVLWARGEPLLLVGPAGVGKTTVAHQLVAALLGLNDKVLDLTVNPARRILYLACDRPAQIRRAMHRNLIALDSVYLDEHLVIWEGPPPRDLAKHPETLAALARDTGADTVVIDSLKDVAIGLSDDEVGAGINIAMQHCVADQIEICALHHQRKGQAGAKPKTLEDVYGSTWITAGAGSVVLLWGAPGDPIVELVHLKQPAAEIGPLKLEHDHLTGTTSVFRGDVDPLRVLRQQRNGMTANDFAILANGIEKPTDAQRKKAKRTLDRLVQIGKAYKVDGGPGGDTGTVPDRYYATADEPDTPTLDGIRDPSGPDPDVIF